jgi:hypothetical protein
MNQNVRKKSQKKMSESGHQFQASIRNSEYVPIALNGVAACFCLSSFHVTSSVRSEFYKFLLAPGITAKARVEEQTREREREREREKEREREN